MGADSFAGLHRWRRWRELPDSLPLLVMDRPGWTFRALSSPAAGAYRWARVCDHQAPILPLLAPPAWGFVNMPLRKESSTAIRKATVAAKTHAEA
jgi:nicotinate-nucleotide adenylyltransferase